MINNSQGFQHHIPDRMAISVVDLLEIIQIKEDDTEILLVTDAAVHFSFCDFSEFEPVADLGQTIHGGPNFGISSFMKIYEQQEFHQQKN